MPTLLIISESLTRLPKAFGVRRWVFSGSRKGAGTSNLISSPLGKYSRLRVGIESAIGLDGTTALIDAVGVPMAIVNSDFIFLSVNSQFEEVFHFTRLELSGCSHLEIIDSAVRDFVANQQQVLRLEDRSSHRIQIRTRTRLDEVFESELTVAPVKIDGQPVYILTYRDLRKPGSILPLGSAEMYRVTIQDSPLAISIQDQNFKIVLVNKAYCALTGYTESELIGHDPAEMLHPPELAPELAVHRQHMKRTYRQVDSSLVLVREMLGRDGRRIRYRSDLSRTYGLNGELLFVATITDLSKLEETKDKLDEHMRLTRFAQARFDTFSALSTDAIIVCDATTGKITQANKSVRTVLGLEAVSLIGEPCSTITNQVAPADRQAVANLLDGIGVDDGAECIVRVDRPLGGVSSVRLRIVDTGHVAERFVLAEDVSTRLERDRQLQRAAQRQREALIHEVHHRIKNGLHSVSALLERGRFQDGTPDQVLSAAIARVEAIAQVHGLLIDSPRRVPLDDLSKAVFASVEATYDVSLQVTHQSRQDAHWMVTEQESVPIALVLNELSTNAVKYSQAGSQVKLEIVSDASGARIRITNTGSFSHSPSAESATSGLGLVHALLPPSHAKLSITQQEAQVVALLTLTPPIIVADDRELSAAA
ncbi:MAG: PAS domain S-box protein [Burkholderiaceae bacterium]